MYNRVREFFAGLTHSDMWCSSVVETSDMACITLISHILFLLHIMIIKITKIIKLFMIRHNHLR